MFFFFLVVCVWNYYCEEIMNKHYLESDLSIPRRIHEFMRYLNVLLGLTISKFQYERISM